MDNKHLEHAGIKGMKWGQRRFQNKDGSLTPLGKKRYGNNNDSDSSSSDAKTVPGRKPLFDTKIKKTPVDKGDFSPESFAAAKVKTEARVRVIERQKQAEKNTIKPENKKIKNTKKNDSEKQKIEEKKKQEEPKVEESKTESSKKPDSTRVAKAVGSAATLAGQATKEAGVNIHRAAVKAKNTKDMKDYKSMTNAELKAEVERIRLENDYVNVSMAKMTAAQHKTESVISIVGNSLNVVGSAANTYAAIMSIFNKD